MSAGIFIALQHKPWIENFWLLTTPFEGDKIWKKGGEFMKARVMTLPLFLFAGFLVSSCATLDRLNTEYEEDTTRVAQMTPQDKADWEKEEHENFMIEMKGYFGDGD